MRKGGGRGPGSLLTALAGDMDSHLTSGSLGFPIFDRVDGRCRLPHWLVVTDQNVA